MATQPKVSEIFCNEKMKTDAALQLNFLIKPETRTIFQSKVILQCHVQLFFGRK